METVGPESGSRPCSRDARTGRMLPVPTAQRFWAKVRKTDGCWLWVGARGSNGYGYIRHDGRDCGAHRVSYELHRGPIPSGLQVRHDCDTPLCVNPAHMRLGTVRDNAQDKLRRGRMPDVEPPHYYGEQHPGHKLTSADVTLIKEMRAQGTPYSTLASVFGVTKQQIAHIVKGRQRLNG